MVVVFIVTGNTGGEAQCFSLTIWKMEKIAILCIYGLMLIK